MASTRRRRTKRCAVSPVCRYALSQSRIRTPLNDDGVNLIRPLNGAIRVWGARTVGGDANGEYRYISTRRYFNYLRESIDEGTQFVVFEPNTPALWERIKRTVGGFLLREWRDGALFGTTAEKAFFVKCDADTNPPEVREAGQGGARIACPERSRCSRNTCTSSQSTW